MGLLRIPGAAPRRPGQPNDFQAIVSRVLSGHSAYGANAIATLCGILAGVIVMTQMKIQAKPKTRRWGPAARAASGWAGVVALRILRAEDLKTVPHGAKLAKLLHLR